MTNEQLLAFLAFGLIVMNEPESLLENMSNSEIKDLANDVDKYLSPFVNDDQDMVAIIVKVLKDAVMQMKEGT